jgi:hypothetical protein
LFFELTRETLSKINLFLVQIVLTIYISSTNTLLQMGIVMSNQDILNGKFTSNGIGVNLPVDENSGPQNLGPNQTQPPIFFGEEIFPGVELADEIYYQFALSIGRTWQVIEEDKRYPGHHFLVFHYLGSNNLKNADKNRTNSYGANKGNLADKVSCKELQKHETPYACTVEGGGGALTFPVPACQNQLHGTMLQSFFRENNFVGGEEFWIPLPDISSKKRAPKTVPVPIPVPKFEPKTGPPVLIPVVLAPVAEEAAGEVALELLLEWGWIILL